MSDTQVTSSQKDDNADNDVLRTRAENALEGGATDELENAASSESDGRASDCREAGEAIREPESRRSSEGTSPEQAAGVEVEFIETRRRFAGFFVVIIGAVFVLVTASVAVMLWIVAVSDLRPTEKALTVQLLQVGLGMILGFASMAFGVAITWVGVTTPFRLRAAGGPSERRSQLLLESAGPGLVLLLGGLILIGVSLYKPIKYSEMDYTPDTQLQPLKKQG